MLDQDTKRKINNLRNILVGKVPDPKSQVDQITLALIYKAMYDMDKRSKGIGGKATFFKADFKKYSWDKIISSSISGTQRVKLYEQALDKFSKAQHFPRFFRDVFKQSTLPYRDEETLRLFVKEIDSFDYNDNKNGSDNSEGLGDAFEHILSYLGSQGDAGQFRTPRHIIDFIVEVVEPKKNETIFDPACGTAGFLISSFKSIIRKNSRNYKPKEYIHGFEQTDDLDASSSSIQPDGQFKGKKLTPSEWKKLYKNIKGYDISPDMVKLSSVNLFLHKFKDPDISPTDTLTSLNVWEKSEYDVILANPPFMTPKGGIRPHNKFSIKSKSSEVLFVEYIMEHLKLKGRAGIIVPEGVIFISNKAYKSLRKKLIEDNFLWAVMSLPSKVFKPYSGVKTSILFLDKKRAKKEDQILFIDVKNDGFDLGDKRRRIDSNDLPRAFEDLRKHKKGEFNKSSISFLVNKNDIKTDENYNLSANLYKPKQKVTSKYEMVKLENIISYEQPTNYIVESTNYKDEYKMPVLTAGKSFILGYTDEKKGIFPESKLPVIIFDDFTTDKKFVDFSFKVKSSAMKILLPNKSKIIPYFAYLMMKQISFNSSKHKRYWISEYSKETIPLPPLSVQKEIVAEVEGYQSIIDGANQIIDNWKPAFKIDPEWQMVKLSDVCEVLSGGTPSTSVKKYWNGDIPWITPKDLSNYEDKYISKGQRFITLEGLQNSSAKELPKNTVLLSTRAPIGYVAIAQNKLTTNQGFKNLVTKKECDHEYIFYILKSMTQYLNSLGSGATFKEISKTQLEQVEIPLPPLSVQKKIVEKIQEEEEIVESNKKLIKINEEKITKRLSKLFNK